MAYYGGGYGPPSGGGGGYGYAQGGGYGYGQALRGGTGRRDSFDSISLPHEDFSDLPAFEKSFYQEHPATSARSEEEVARFRKSMAIHMEGRGAPKPVLTLEEASFPASLLRELYAAHFSKPTTIQSAAWPCALSGRDLIAVAETGSGKTLSYLLPSFVHIVAQPYLKPGEGPIVLILAPTRELAVQIAVECHKFGASSRIKSTCVYGGAPRGAQMRDLRSGVEVVIATPGRLLDLLEARATNVRRVTYLVFDEADRMLDMGFEPQIRRVVAQIRPDRQTLMFTASFPREVEAIARDFLTLPLRVTIGSTDLAANHAITQHICVLSEREKFPMLVNVLAQGAPTRRKTLIFTDTKRAADAVTRQLRADGFPALSIHGDKAQPERDFVMSEFRLGRCPILVATDVASRGIDVKDIGAVINHDFPSTCEDYVHRIAGLAVSFFTTANARLARGLVDILREANQPVPPELAALVHSGGGGGGGGGFRSRGYSGGGYRGSQSSGANTAPLGPASPW